MNDGDAVTRKVLRYRISTRLARLKPGARDAAWVQARMKVDRHLDIEPAPGWRARAGRKGCRLPREARK